MTFFRQNLIAFFVIVVCVSSIVYTQNKHESHRIKKDEVLYFVPKKEHLAFTTFGFKSVISDLLWLKSIAYFFYHIGGDNDFKYLAGMQKACIAMDPRFKQVYKDAMTFLLNDELYYREAEDILLAGVENRPEDWEMCYMAGMMYAFYLKDKEKALVFFEKCWVMLEAQEGLLKEKYNVSAMIKNITEKTIAKNDLIIYWLKKYENAHSQSAQEYYLFNSKRYLSVWMEDVLNQMIQLKLTGKERLRFLKEHHQKIIRFCKQNGLTKLFSLNMNKLFVENDSFNQPWVFSEVAQKYYSFTNAQYSIKRKIRLMNIRLIGNLGKYRTKEPAVLLQIPQEQRESFFQLKPEFSSYPPINEVFKDSKWLGLEYPLHPRYLPKEGVLRVPTRQDLSHMPPEYR